MMLLRNRIARAFAAGALVLTIPALAACGSSFATDKVYTPAAGANDRSGDVDVLGASIVASQDGSGTLIGTFANNKISQVQDGFPDSSDALTAVGGNFQATLADASALTIPAAGTLVLSAAETDVPGIPVDGDFKLGDFVEVTFEFEKADSVTFAVPVVCNANHFAGQDTNPKSGELAEACQAAPVAEGTGSEH